VIATPSARDSAHCMSPQGPLLRRYRVTPATLHAALASAASPMGEFGTRPDAVGAAPGVVAVARPVIFPGEKNFFYRRRVHDDRSFG